MAWKGPVRRAVTGGGWMRRAVAVLLMALLGLAPATAASGSDVVVVPGTSFPTGDTYLSWFGCAGLFGRRRRRTQPHGRGRRRSTPGQPCHPAGDARDRAGLGAGGPGRLGGWRRLVDVGTAGLGWAGRRARLVRLLGARQGEVWSGRTDLAATAGRLAAGRRRRQRPVQLDPGRRRDRRGPRAGRDRHARRLHPARAATGPATCWPASGCDGEPFGWTLGLAPARSRRTTSRGVPVSTTIAASASQVAPGPR